MRYKPEHKAQARATILAAAGRRLRREGLHGVGVDALMTEVGMTSGAIYSHFRSKDGLFQEVLRAGFADLEHSLLAAHAQSPNTWLAEYASGYLSREHCANVEGGCILPSLSVDAARTEATQELYQAELERIIALIASAMPGHDEAEQEHRARVYLATLVGGVTLARALPPGADAEAVLAAARQAALALVQP